MILIIVRLGTPLLLGGLLRYFRKDDALPYEIALCYAAGICLATAVNVLSGNQTIFGAFHVGAKVRVAVCSVVYRKVGKSQVVAGERAPRFTANLRNAVATIVQISRTDQSRARNGRDSRIAYSFLNLRAIPESQERGVKRE